MPNVGNLRLRVDDGRDLALSVYRSPRDRGLTAKCVSSPRGDEVAIANVPSILPMQDAPALASALAAAHTAWQRNKRGDAH
ncbi:hypothetical protein AWC10_23925 [Mycobacteroides immunogenum]|nr:hypothetical protein AWC10_23925 [Mycobacteroides immunogenum]